MSGILFVAFFIAGLVFSGVLASVPLPMPDAPAAEAARYYSESQAAVLVSGLLQALSAVSLLVFAPCVAAFTRRTAGEGDTLSRLTLGGGILAAAFLLLSALLSWVLALVAAGGDLALVGTLRYLNFHSGGDGPRRLVGFVRGSGLDRCSRSGGASPVGPLWLGIAAAALSMLSLASLVLFPASVLIPLGRLLAFVWSVAVSLVLARNNSSTGERA